MQVLVKKNDTLIFRTSTDGYGNFKLADSLIELKGLDVFCYGIGMDTVYIGSLTHGTNANEVLKFSVPIRFKKNLFGKAVCPKCANAKATYKIVHSIAPGQIRTISAKGDTTWSNLINGTYQDGCVFGGAKYYCDRDKIKF